VVTARLQVQKNLAEANEVAIRLLRVCPTEWLTGCMGGPVRRADLRRCGGSVSRPPATQGSVEGAEALPTLAQRAHGPAYGVPRSPCR
jgi:hypothetical protein